MWFIVIIMLLVCIGMPLGYAWRVSRLDTPSLSDWLVAAADSSVLVALVLILGRWDMAGYFVRFAVLAIFLAALAWSLSRHFRRPWTAPGLVARQLSPGVSLLVFGSALAYVVIFGLMPPNDVRELAFPLKGGRFIVGQGGGIGLLNHHASHDEQRYAADIGAIGPLGYRAAGLAPDELERYAVHGAEVVSPCAGEVVATQNDLPDLIPPERDRDNARGNHAIIDCGGFHVELAHLLQGSVSVAQGQRLEAGDTIGKVGNSGNTTEPHLHIHAVDIASRKGVPMSFGGRTPVRNRVFAN